MPSLDELTPVDSENGNSFYRIKAKGKLYHMKVPMLNRLPFASVAIIALLVFINIAVWTAVGVVLSYHTSLVSTAVLSYSLGLRHALDADHISAIDLMTRRLIATGQRPVTVGTFFSLGHSTIVIITSIVVASTAAAVSSRFGSFSKIGGIIGSTVSATFLIVLGVMNIYILYKLLKALKQTIATPISAPQPDFTIEGGGCLFRVLKRMFRLIDRPWKMYPLGVLFGLGFDTSSEIALLGIAAISASQGTSIWLILLFPILFTSGMCLLDTLDGALMMALYTSTRLAKDNIAVLYFQAVLTGITVLVAMVIGVIQLLSMVQGAADLEGGFWEGVVVASDNYDVIGGGICGSFVVFGVLSAILYRPWRRRVDEKRRALERWPGEEEGVALQELQVDEGLHGRPEEVGEAPLISDASQDRKGLDVV